MVGLTGFLRRANIAAGGHNVRAGKENAISEHVVRRLSQAERHAQAEENRSREGKTPGERVPRRLLDRWFHKRLDWVVPFISGFLRGARGLQ